jgi:K+ transporter
MYSINVFATFSLSEMGMCRFWVKSRKEHPDWTRHILIHVIGLILCLSILTGTVIEKFGQGAWLTLVITALAIFLCMAIRAHYRSIAAKLRSLDKEFDDLPSSDHHGGAPEPGQPTAVLLVGGYGGVGVHSLLTIQRHLPNYFKNVIFVSVAVVDSGSFKGAAEVGRLRESVDDSLKKYVELARRLGWNADYRTATGIEAVAESTRLCLDLAREFPRVMFFSGKLLWRRESWYQRLLHNETAFQIQRRLQWKGLPMAVLPLRVPER